MSANTRIATIFAGAALAIAGAMATKHEGTRYEAYQDTGGTWTICEGDTHGVKPGDKATREECDARLRANLTAANDAFDRCVSEPVSIFERAAYIDFDFNVGEGNFCRSTLVKKLNIGDHKGACDELLKWVYVDGRDCRIVGSNCYGIVTRRKSEHDLCLQGVQ